MGCHSGSETTGESTAQPAAVAVITQPVQQLTQRHTVALSGALEADKTVDVGFQIGGRVSRVEVEEGGRVRQGQVLARLDPGSYRFALDAATATLARAQDEYGRLQLMYDRGSLTPSDLEAARTAVAQARAQQLEGIVAAGSERGSSTPMTGPAVVVLVENDAPVERARLVQLAEPVLFGRIVDVLAAAGPDAIVEAALDARSMSPKH